MPEQTGAVKSVGDDEAIERGIDGCPTHGGYSSSWMILVTDILLPCLQLSLPPPAPLTDHPPRPYIVLSRIQVYRVYEGGWTGWK